MITPKKPRPGRRPGTPNPAVQGERHHFAALDEAKVRAIRMSEGLSDYRLAKMFGVTPPTIKSVRERKTGKHVP